LDNLRSETLKTVGKGLEESVFGPDDSEIFRFDPGLFATAPVDAPVAVSTTTAAPQTHAPVNGLRKTSSPVVERPLSMTTSAPQSLLPAPVSAPVAAPTIDGKCRSKCLAGFGIRVHKTENGRCTKRCQIICLNGAKVRKGWTCEAAAPALACTIVHTIPPAHLEFFLSRGYSTNWVWST
jgi:hypothetical protein